MEVGTEVNCIDEGFDYVVAVVNKLVYCGFVWISIFRISGETTYRPARLFQFEAKYASDPKVLLGHKFVNLFQNNIFLKKESA